MDWWDYMVDIDWGEGESFSRQVQVQPPDLTDLFPKEISRRFGSSSTDKSRAVLREQCEKFSKERELAMPFKHETYLSIACTAGAIVMESRPLKIKNVIFNDPATIVFWGDGTKTVVKCKNEEFDKENGLAMAYMKKMLGNKGRYFNEVKKWTREENSNDQA